VKVGLIPYLNLYPLYFYLKDRGFQFIRGVPTELNNLIRKGLIDISPSSSVEYLRRPEHYRLIPGHSISSSGEVRSIILFSRLPLEELKDKKILSTYHSGTSVLLLEIILKRFYNMDFALEVTDIPLEKALEIADAYLLIGDDALRGLKYSSGYYCYDLGLLWQNHTGLPFVYALWITKKELDEREFLKFTEELDRAKDYALQNLKELALTLKGQSFLDTEEIVEYWKGLSYDFTPEHEKGLELFKKYLVEMGLL